MHVPEGLSRKGTGVIVFWLTAVLVTIADQATKVAVRHVLPLGSPAVIAERYWHYSCGSL